MANSYEKSRIQISASKEGFMSANDERLDEREWEDSRCRRDGCGDAQQSTGGLNAVNMQALGIYERIRCEGGRGGIDVQI
jgi:hypothetical protein